MSGKDLLLRLAVPAILIVYVLPVTLMDIDASRMWLADMQHMLFKAGPISTAFMYLIGQSNGPVALLHRSIGVLASGAIIATLWSSKDRLLDTLMVGTLVVGVVASLMVWSILCTPHIYQEVWQAANLPNVADSKSFGALRDQYFTDEISALISFGAVLTGIKLKG